MKTFWIVLLVAFLVFIVVNAIRGRHYSEAVYRARFRNRMPQRKAEAANDASFVAVPVLFGATTDSTHHPSADCASHSGGVDAGGSCGDGGSS
jgi:hypothetical protein